MTHQNNNGINLIGRILFMVFFLLIICVKSDNPERHNNFVSSYEMLTEMHSASSHVAIIDFVQTPVLQKSLSTFNDKTGLSLFNENFKLTADNSRINRQFVCIQKTLLLLKPASFCRFYYHLFPSDSKEPPLLG